jgi:hypothetical protein
MARRRCNPLNPGRPYTGGVAYWYNESTNSSTYEASGAAVITAGTDNSGYLLLDMLFTNGNLSQSQGGGWWTSLGSNVASIGKAHAGVLNAVFNGDDAYTDSLYSTKWLVFPVEQHHDGSVICRAVDEKRRV